MFKTIKKYQYLLVLLISILIFGFQLRGKSAFKTPFLIKTNNDSTYIKSIEAWHQQRLMDLKAEKGWLNLAGLYWLKEGKNTFGSDKSNQLVFPKGASFIGNFILNNGEVSVEINENSAITVQSELIKSQKIYPSDKDIVMEYGALRWFVIKRGDKYGIRLRDLESPTLLHFKDIDTYPIDENWRIKATLERPATEKRISITDVLGHTSMQVSPGTLVFSIKGKTYRLEAVEGEKKLFIIFKDATSGKDTYGAGRFLYAEMPQSDGVTYLDFNKAVNPPCAFTEYATCPLAPQQNWLTIPITAGEKNYSEH